MAVLFWIVLAICVYAYAGYPALVFIAGAFRARAVGKAPYFLLQGERSASQSSPASARHGVQRANDR